MSQSKFLLKYHTLRSHFHKQYVHVRLHTKALESLTCRCQDFRKEVNGALPGDLQLDMDSPLPQKVPDYKKHVLLLSPQDKSATELEWMSLWQSKLELNHLWPYSVIANLKRHLKNSKLGSSVLVNAISMQSGSIESPKRGPHEKAHIFVFPDMKLYKILPQDIESFAYFLGGGHIKQTESHNLSFEDFLNGANNVTNKTQLIPEAANVRRTFEHDENLENWILICGHNQRDKRCGIVGQALVNEISTKDRYKDRNVAIISHIGGHKYAGNLILYNYMGTDQVTRQKQLDSLWFARVSPPNFTTLLENVNAGKIPEEYYRGGLSLN